jgi:hypothetical protein
MSGGGPKRTRMLIRRLAQDQAKPRQAKPRQAKPSQAKPSQDQAKQRQAQTSPR